jgi:hypothetical protein
VLERTKPSSGGEKKNITMVLILERYSMIVENFWKREESSCVVFFLDVGDFFKEYIVQK